MKNYKLKINGNEYNVDINEVEGQEIKLDVNGTSYVVTVDQEIKQQRKPKFSTREYTRCRICGRPHAYLRKYGICRICFRELAYKGQIPGVKKASW